VVSHGCFGDGGFHHRNITSAKDRRNRLGRYCDIVLVVLSAGFGLESMGSICGDGGVLGACNAPLRRVAVMVPA
jgi:hypothetical protein